MSTWLVVAQRLKRQGTAFVMVTVAATKGSTPREAGTKMLVTEREAIGTIGGGHLEYRAIEMARNLLNRPPGAVWRRFALGPSLGQCCGGVVDLLFEHEAADRLGWVDVLVQQVQQGIPAVLAAAIDGERRERMVVTSRAVWQDGAADPATLTLARQWLVVSDGRSVLVRESPSAAGADGRQLMLERIEPPGLDVVLFGAGHVGRALVGVLGMLPCRVTWVDSRLEEFCTEPPDNVIIECTDTPEAEVEAAAPGACFLVMTHSHALDFSLTTQILTRGEFRYFGLIGSATKRKKFERRLRDRGVPDSTLARIQCPIGIEGVSGKEPGVIAVAVAAQLLRLRESPSMASTALGGKGESPPSNLTTQRSTYSPSGEPVVDAVL